ncbi:hypothetical protein VNO78_16102 [Psophocarpus tetragonolobus]|uniref:Uncharacterized protein n=1 Tax=Psophocarpus tetragonolobus TaxID=3891 RepID=A0AAN9SG49_PSOTE
MTGSHVVNDSGNVDGSCATNIDVANQPESMHVTNDESKHVIVTWSEKKTSEEQVAPHHSAVTGNLQRKKNAQRSGKCITPGTSSTKKKRENCVRMMVTRKAHQNSMTALMGFGTNSKTHEEKQQNMEMNVRINTQEVELIRQYQRLGLKQEGR